MPVIKVNFRGGIIQPAELYNILVAAGKYNVRQVRFGLRQQLFIETAYKTTADAIEKELENISIAFERDNDKVPNVVSSYPAEDVFIAGNWLEEETYKNLFKAIDYKPEAKINICNNNQSFTPSLTGNINWIASHLENYWYLFIRFPKTNIVYGWKDLVHSTSLVAMSKKIEATFKHPKLYSGQEVDGDAIYARVMVEPFNVIPVTLPAELPKFNLPYYEGFNLFNGKYWLGIYRRDEWFNVDFLKALCLKCLDHAGVQLCCTCWKSLIVRGIEEKDLPIWNDLLSGYHINVRHADNELNFQVEDNCKEGLALKHYIVKRFNRDDIRTYGICIGIKTRRKSEVFSSILVRRRPLLRLFKRGFFHVYDILCAKDYNPNERTEYIFSSGNPRIFVPEQLRRAIFKFYEQTALTPTPANEQHSDIPSVEESF